MEGICLLIDIPSDGMTRRQAVWGGVGVVCGSAHSSTDEEVKYPPGAYLCVVNK
jgi:hypothetical protein